NPHASSIRSHACSLVTGEPVSHSRRNCKVQFPDDRLAKNDARRRVSLTDPQDLSMTETVIIRAGTRDPFFSNLHGIGNSAWWQCWWQTERYCATPETTTGDRKPAPVARFVILSASCYSMGLHS